MNILVVRTDKLGDFITALPSIYVLKNYNKNNKIIACVAPLNVALAKSCDFIDEVIIDNPNESIFEFAKKLKRFNIDVSLTLFSNTRVAIVQWLAGIPMRIAPATKIAQIFYTNRVKQKRSEVKMAEFEYNLQLIKTLFPDINLEYKKPLLHFEDSKEIYKQFCSEHRIIKEVVAFHVGFGGSSDANWELDEYTILIKEVLKRGKYQPVLTFGPDEKVLCKEMQKRLKDEKVIFYISEKGIVHFAKLISNFKLFVSTSTGTYHLASLVGCPTMTFFGDSLFASSARWQAIGDEKLQKHYMLPNDKTKRDEMFENVREDMSSVI